MLELCLFKKMSVQAFDIDFSGNLSTLFIDKHISNANVRFFSLCLSLY